jgi:DNA-binding protein HU-beta
VREKALVPDRADSYGKVEHRVARNRRRTLSPKGRIVNKAQLIDVVAQNLDVSRRVAGDAVDAVLAGITGAVIDGDRVSLTGFGTFETAHRPARTARNPRTGDQVRVAASTVPKFRAGQAFKDEVNGAKPKAAAKKTAVKSAVKSAAKKTAATTVAAKKAAPARKAAAPAAPAKKAAAPAKKAVVKKAVAKAVPAKKTATKSAARPMAKKSVAKAPATKTAAKKTVAKKTVAKKTTAKKR